MIMQSKKKIIFLSVFWSLVVLPFILLFTIFILIANEKIGYIPDFEELENPKSKLAAEVYSTDKKLLGKYYKENRTVVQYDDISPFVFNALIATEDIRFYSHSGIDFKGLGRVFFKSVLFGQDAGGGSTISQQLAKNLYRMREQEEILNIPSTKVGKVWKVMKMKFSEWVTAALLERNYTKEEILVMYLNTVTFGHNAFGIKSAARIFFNKLPIELTIEESAVLVGLLKAPSKYSPKSNPQNAKNRRNTVLSQIEKYQNKLSVLTGFQKLSKHQIDSLKKLPINLKFRKQSHNEGLATYFREFLRIYLTAAKPVKDNYPKWAYNKFIEDSIEWESNPLYGWCNRNFKPDGTPYNLYSDGLRIYTTIDSRMQQYAEEATLIHMGLGDKVHNNPSLQSVFSKELDARGAKHPFSYRLSQKEINDIMNSSMRRSERYNTLLAAGWDTASIRKSFFKPTEMTVFKWNSTLDTTVIMTPWDSIIYYKRFLRAGFMSMEPGTGYVKAYIGGANFDHFKFDHVMLSRRQVGSTFKPFVYTVYMMKNSPCTKIPNIEVTFEMPAGQNPPYYTPQFSPSKLDGQMITLKTGLALSLNQVSAWVMKQVGPESVVRIARNMGVKSPLDPVYSLCVGSAEVKLSEMVAAYGAFANKGVFVEPVFVTKIEDKNGNVIASFVPKKNQAIDENTAYRMVEMMRGVVDNGTSTRIRYKYNIKADIAGKTGTTNNNSDGWFIGITPRLVSGGWVGGEERSIQFSSTTLGQGANMALPIWALFMEKVYADPSLGYSQSEKFKEPEIGDGIESDCNEYQTNDNNYFQLGDENF